MFLAAAAGFVVLALFVVVWPIGWATSALLLAALVLVPLGLSLLRSRDGPAPGDAALRLVSWFQCPAAICLMASATLPAGGLGGTLALPWLAVTFLIAAGGLARLIGVRPWQLDQVCTNAGQVYLAVAGIWTVLSRFGVRPMGFEDQIVLLTAVHFHYAGFVLPILAGQLGRVCDGISARFAECGVVVGVPAVAIGIAFSPILEWLAASVLAVMCIIVAMLEFELGLRSEQGPARWLWLTSAPSLCVAMLLASVYAAGEYWGVKWLTIPEMLPTHGAINAVGFAMCGLAAWSFARHNS
jgi:hypothetical protein